MLSNPIQSNPISLQGTPKVQDPSDPVSIKVTCSDGPDAPVLLQEGVIPHLCPYQVRDVPGKKGREEGGHVSLPWLTLRLSPPLSLSSFLSPSTPEPRLRALGVYHPVPHQVIRDLE